MQANVPFSHREPVIWTAQLPSTSWPGHVPVHGRPAETEAPARAKSSPLLRPYVDPLDTPRTFALESSIPPFPPKYPYNNGFHPRPCPARCCSARQGGTFIPLVRLLVPRPGPAAPFLAAGLWCCPLCEITARCTRGWRALACPEAANKHTQLSCILTDICDSYPSTLS